MIGKIIVAVFLILLVAGLGASGTIGAVAKGYHNISSNPTIHQIGFELYNGTKSELSSQLQNFTNNTLEQQLK